MLSTNVSTFSILVLTDCERDVGGPRNAKNAAACHAYTRDQLLGCKQTNAHLNPSVINRLKELSIGYRLPRHRSCRGGTRKRWQIPVVVSQRRSQDNTLFLPDCVPCTTPTPPSSPDVSLCSTARLSRANLQNLIKVPLQSSDLPNQLCVCLFNAKSVGVARKHTAIDRGLSGRSRHGRYGPHRDLAQRVRR
ncbi:hypothetical protein ACOMHN_041163 [Nucella lapillus]